MTTQIQTTSRATLLTRKALAAHKPSIPASWKKVAGLLSRNSDIDPVSIQRKLRKQWDARIERLAK